MKTPNLSQEQIDPLVQLPEIFKMEDYFGESSTHNSSSSKTDNLKKEVSSNNEELSNTIEFSYNETNEEIRQEDLDSNAFSNR